MELEDMNWEIHSVLYYWEKKEIFAKFFPHYSNSWIAYFLVKVFYQSTVTAITLAYLIFA